MSLRLRLIAVATGRARAGRLSGAWPRPAAALAAWPKLRVDSESDHGALSRTCNATRDSNRAHWQFKSVAASFKFRVTGKSRARRRGPRRRPGVRVRPLVTVTVTDEVTSNTETRKKVDPAARGGEVTVT